MTLTRHNSNSICNLWFGSLVWDLWFGIFGLGSSVWDLWFWIFGFGSLVWELLFWIFGIAPAIPGRAAVLAASIWFKFGIAPAIPGRAAVPAGSRLVCVSVSLLLMLNENPKK